MASSQLSHANQVIVPRLEVARTLWARTKGLLGRSQLAPDQGLWILQCNSVHTFFMKFAIDLVFLNREMVVTKTVRRVGPGRVILPVMSARSVIELSAGFLDNHPIQVGETLHVDSTLS